MNTNGVTFKWLVSVLVLLVLSLSAAWARDVTTHMSRLEEQREAASVRLSVLESRLQAIQLDITEIKAAVTGGWRR